MLILGLFILSQVARPETLLVCHIGKKEGEIGVAHGEMAWGPEDFSVDENGNIYIYDCQNIPPRIDVFDKDGRLKAVYTQPEKIREMKRFFPLALNLKADYKGYIHLHRRTPDVTFLNLEIIVSPDLRDTIAVIKKEESEISDYYSYDRIIKISESGRISFYEMILPKSKKPVIPQKKLIKEYDYSTKSKTYRKWLRMEGEDKDGNFYVILYKNTWTGHGTETERFLQKYSHNGEYLGQIEYKAIRLGALGPKGTYLSPSGDFYVANMDKEKYWIVKYPKGMLKK